jgi:predicted RNase H-like nuclease (RuvC/YqgF family)
MPNESVANRVHREITEIDCVTSRFGCQCGSYESGHRSALNEAAELARREVSTLTATIAEKDRRIEELEKQLRTANAKIEVLENCIVLDAIQNGRTP